MSDWDDDEWDADAIEEAAEKARKRKELEDLGLLEDEEAREAEEKKRKEAQEEAEARRLAQVKEKVVFEEALQDKAAEKARQKKLREDADARMGMDAFDGFAIKEDKTKKSDKTKSNDAGPAAKQKEAEVIVVDAWDKVELKSEKDITKLLGDCFDKMDKGKCTSAPLKFLTDCFKKLEQGLDLAEVEAMNKALTAAIRTKKTLAATKQGSETKTNTNIKNKGNLSKSAHDEYETVYGGGADDWEDWDDWDDWQPAEKTAAKPAAKPAAKAAAAPVAEEADEASFPAL